MIEANNPKLKSWIDVKTDSDFPIQNLPFGLYKFGDHSTHVASIIGDQLIDLAVLHRLGYFRGINLPEGIFTQDSLNPFIGLGKGITNSVRSRLSSIFQHDNAELRDAAQDRNEALKDYSHVVMLLPVKIGDYTDFYSSEQHAFNVGSMFRDPANALLPNWKHLPVGYHGRASSIVVSGEPIHRPQGQIKEATWSVPEFSASRKLDFELEMAFITGKSTTRGSSISTGDAEGYIFGFAMFNDWSARDIQSWEYVPLGPFLGKNFASSMSPWIVTLEALDPFRVSGPRQTPAVLPYLQYEGSAHFDVDLEVYLQPDGEEQTKLVHSNYKYLYWNIRQQLAHQTVTGCNLNIGDVYASGTISGNSNNAFGSMLELSWNGTKPVDLCNGMTRTFIEDGDTVVFRGSATKNGVRIGFGELTNKILPAI